MKTVQTILLFLLTIPFVNAQQRVSGSVTDAKNNPIAGANVYLEGTYDGASTDMHSNLRRWKPALKI